MDKNFFWPIWEEFASNPAENERSNLSWWVVTFDWEYHFYFGFDLHFFLGWRHLWPLTIADLWEVFFLFWIVARYGTDGREKEVGRTEKRRGLRSRSNWSFSGFIFTLIMIILAIIHYHLDHNHDLDHPDHHLQNHVPSWSSSLASSSSSWLTKTRMGRTRMGLN